MSTPNTHTPIDLQLLPWGRVHVYSHGLCHASACAPAELTAEQVSDAVNASHPTGIASRWQHAAEPFVSGQPNPCACEQDADRRHWLLQC